MIIRHEGHRHWFQRRSLLGKQRGKEIDTNLNISNSGAQYRKIGSFLVIGSGWQLSFEEFEALFEVCSSVLLQFVVDLSRARTRSTSTAATTTAVAAAATAAVAANRWRWRDGRWAVDKEINTIITTNFLNFINFIIYAFPSQISRHRHLHRIANT